MKSSTARFASLTFLHHHLFIFPTRKRKKETIYENIHKVRGRDPQLSVQHRNQRIHINGGACRNIRLRTIDGARPRNPHLRRSQIELNCLLQRQIGCDPIPGPPPRGLRLRGARLPSDGGPLLPNGEWVASTDSSGTVRVWGCAGDHVPKNEFRVLSGHIDDLQWSLDGLRIVASGDGKGKSFVRAFMWDSGTNVGEFDGHSRRVLS